MKVISIQKQKNKIRKKLYKMYVFLNEVETITDFEYYNYLQKMDNLYNELEKLESY